jgi:uncharacterized repeat protein (TIGR03847 family)
MALIADFDHIDVITSGAVGEPGRRTFYLQIRSGGETVTIRCEKQQVATISTYLRRALASLPVPEGQPPRTAMQLSEPVDEAFVLGAVALEFNTVADHFVLHLREFSPDIADGDDWEDDADASMGEEPEDDDVGTHPFPGDEGDVLSRVRAGMSRAQAVAFCDHTDRVVAAGRPNCVYCELPIDPDGHFCPRMN